MPSVSYWQLQLQKTKSLLSAPNLSAGEEPLIKLCGITALQPTTGEVFDHWQESGLVGR